MNEPIGFHFAMTTISKQSSIRSDQMRAESIRSVISESSTSAEESITVRCISIRDPSLRELPEVNYLVIEIS